MQKEKLQAYLILEAASEPVKPENVKVYQDNGLFYVSFDTCLQQFNKKNRNGRIYELSPMKASMGAEHIQELMRNGSWFGEAGHPLSKDVERILTIDPKLISHKINTIDFRGERAYGNVSTLDTDHGRNMTKLILQGMEPAFSLRALANVSQTPSGDKIVRSKAHVVTYDWVILPSHKEAYRDKSTAIQTHGSQFASNAKYKNMNGVLTPATESSQAILVNESSIKNFISLESKNVKLVSNVCEVAMESLSITPDMKYAILKEGSETYMVKVEDRIKREINRYMSRF